MLPRLALATALTCSLAVPGLALGHAGLRVPTPRTTDIRAGTSIKTGPCGPYAPGTGARTTLTAGATFTVEFDETINHTGYFQLFYSEVRDTNFVLLQDRIPHSNAAPSPSFANPRAYSTTITVPNVSCSECTLQLIQVMEDRSPPTLYFSCADIAIVGGPSPDAGVVPVDAGQAPDAAPAVDAAGPDAELPMDATPAPDVVVATPDAAVELDAAPPADAAPAAVDAATPDAGVSVGVDAAPGAAVQRNEVGGGCAAVGPGVLGLWAVVGLAAWRRGRRARQR
jgi:hypothetical protein